MSIDLLIARMETHPEEFFDKDMLLDFESFESSVLKSKWGRIVGACIGLTSNIAAISRLVTAEEKDRMSAALVAIMRAAVDGEIMRATMSGEEYGSEAIRNTLRTAQKMKLGQQVSSMYNSPVTIAELQKQALEIEMKRQQAAIYQNAGMQGSNVPRSSADVYNPAAGSQNIAYGDPNKESFWKGLIK